MLISEWKLTRDYPDNPEYWIKKVYALDKHIGSIMILPTSYNTWFVSITYNLSFIDFSKLGFMVYDDIELLKSLVDKIIEETL